MKQTQKELLQEYSDLMQKRLTREDGSYDKGYHRHFMQNAYVLTKLSDGKFYIVENPGIKKRFCFDDSYDYDGAQEMARHAQESHEYFKQANMRHLQEMLELATDPPHYIVWERMHEDKDDQIANITYRNQNWIQADEYSKPVSQEDLDIIADAYRQAIAKHEVRIDRYLKRYGTKHVHSWTYWGDR
jgi:hypothetical protein